LHAPSPHTPLLQAGAALAGAAHAAPHDPQLMTLFDVFTSQPSTVLRLQFWKGAAQAKLHEPCAHVAAALGAPGHAVPHPPQLAGSNAVLVQTFPHWVVPPWHWSPHWPAEQSPSRPGSPAPSE
jgi:hypothetical protein